MITVEKSVKNAAEMDFALEIPFAPTNKVFFFWGGNQKHWGELKF